MTYQISQTDPAELSTEGILHEIEGFKMLAVEVVHRYSLLLAELRKRKQFHAFMRHPILSFFQEIAEGNLDAEAALLLRNREMIKPILPLSAQRQREIAGGSDIAVAVLQDDGSIRSDDMPILRMDKATLKRAFGPSGIRTVAEQADLLRQEVKIEKRTTITAIKDTGVLKIKDQKHELTIKPEELSGPLRDLGYKIVLARDPAKEPV